MDRLSRAEGKPAAMVAVADPDPLKPSVLPSPDSWAFFSGWEKKSNWKNSVTLKRCVFYLSSFFQMLHIQTRRLLTRCKSVECLREYDASAHIHRISPTPLLMTVAENDVCTPTDLALEAYSRAREPKRLHVLPGGHFEAYSGPNFERNVSFQAQFLKEYLL